MTRSKLRDTKIDISLSVILLGATIILFGSTAYFFRFGLDLTDESFYISWLTGWDKYGGSTSLFGPVLGQVVGNVPLQSMRLIGFFLLTFACILLGLILAKDTSDIASSVSIFSICALGGVAHLGWLPWIPTPNYNSLTMFGLLIFASAFLPVFRSADARISPAILGVSAAIIFMGKPSSALSLGFIFPLLLFRLSVLEFCGISLRTAIWFLASILVVFFYIFSDLSAALDFLAFGVASSHRTLSYASIFSMLQTLLLAVGLVFTIPVLLKLSPQIGNALNNLSKHETPWLVRGGKISSLNFVICLAVIPSLTAILLLMGQGPYYWKALIPLYLGCILGFAILKPSFPIISLIQSAAPLFLALSFVIGTGNPYGFQITGAWVFLLLGPIIFWSKIPLEYRERQLVTYCLAITNLICVSMLLLHSVNNPYRQSNAAYAYEYDLRALNPKLNVLVDVNDGKFYREITKIANQFSIERETPMVDFSGQTPGISLFLQTVHLGSPWHIGSERGVQRRFIFYLTKYCELLPEAWLIDEPEGAYRHDTELLANYNLSLKEDYIEVTRLVWRGREFAFYQPRKLKKLNQNCEVITSQN